MLFGSNYVYNSGTHLENIAWVQKQTPNNITISVNFRHWTEHHQLCPWALKFANPCFVSVSMSELCPKPQLHH